MITVLGVDPSSSKTGYAVMSSSDRLIECGILTPRRTRDEPLLRIADMADSLAEVIDELSPDYAVVELPSGHAHGGIRGRVSAHGQATYGLAVGYMLRLCVEKLPTARVVGIDANTWTAAQPKRTRQNAIAAIFSAYNVNASRDRGADAADAIGLLLYWFAAREREQREIERLAT